VRLGGARFVQRIIEVLKYPVSLCAELYGSVACCT